MATDDQGDLGTGQGLAERARQNAEANAYVTQRDHPSTPTEAPSNPYATTLRTKSRISVPRQRARRRCTKKRWIGRAG